MSGTETVCVDGSTAVSVDHVEELLKVRRTFSASSPSSLVNWCAWPGACQCAACARSWNFNTCVAGALRLRDKLHSMRGRACTLVVFGRYQIEHGRVGLQRKAGEPV